MERGRGGKLTLNSYLLPPGTCFLIPKSWTGIVWHRYDLKDALCGLSPDPLNLAELVDRCSEDTVNGTEMGQ